jgi:DNA topoisomerase-3
MGYELVIAEKNELVDATLKYMYQGKKTGYYYTCDENKIIMATNGHMMTLLDPEEYDPALKAWSLATIPWENHKPRKKPDPSKAAQFKVLLELIAGADSIIHAGDNDDEGQLIVDEILQYAKWTGKVKRVYITDNTADGVKKAYANLIDNHLKVTDGYAAEARSIADKNFGFMMTRLYTCLAKEQGFSGVLNVGRVQTALRGLVVRRDREFEAHSKAYYYTVTGLFNIDNVSFNANYQVNPIADPVDEKNRIIDKDFANNLVSKITGKPAKIFSISTTKKQTPPPLPFNKSEITAAAAKKFKIKLDVIDKTLEDLRLVHELITYGRSDSRYLSDGIFADSPLRLESVAANCAELADIISHTDTTIKGKAFNNSLCPVHHGIIPTQKLADISKLSAIERNMYLFIAQSFIAQFLPNHQYDQTNLTLEVESQKFTTSSKLVTVNGWKDVFAEIDVEESELDEEADSSGLQSISNGSIGLCNKGTTNNKETKPRPRYTLPTLVKDINNIAKYVKDEKIKKLLIEKDKDNPDINSSIGTVATQNIIIKESFNTGFLVEDAKGNITSSPICRDLHDILSEQFTMPDLTALWYEQQKLIAAGKLTVSEFTADVFEFMGKEIAKVKADGIKLNIEMTPCPKCGKALRRQDGKFGWWWGCSGYPDCDAKYKDNNGKPILDVTPKVEVKTTGEKCPECLSDLVERPGKFGKFIACSGYPKCKWTPPKPDKPAAIATDIKCPTCKTGMLVKRASAKGEFLGCNKFPSCKHIEGV